MKRAHSEHDLQRAVVKLLRSGILHPDVFWTAINPLPGRTPQAGAQAKQLGVNTGVPDLVFVYRAYSLWIELKAEKRGRVSKEQAAVHAQIIRAHRGARGVGPSTGCALVVNSTNLLMEILSDADMLRVKRSRAA